MKLNELSDNSGARKNRTRVGRGEGSGKGKTCGAGHKGQRARTGVAIGGFEGGQMPLHMRLPKRGFTPINRVENQVVNLCDIAKALEAGRLEKGAKITAETLRSAGIIRRNGSGPVRLLAKGDLKAKCEIVVDSASPAAVEAVKKAGGSVSLTTAPAA